MAESELDQVRQQLAEYQKSFALCEVHVPDLWEGDGTCVICEAVHQNDLLKAAEAKLAEAEAEIRLLEQGREDATIRALKAERQHAAIRTALSALIEEWRKKAEQYGHVSEEEGTSDGRASRLYGQLLATGWCANNLATLLRETRTE